MVVLEFQFPAGRYHATPWGRNVNEGVVEWPPSPYRLARALIDVCHRRRPGWPDERLAAVLRPLAATPVFRLPPATASHTRSFLSSNTTNTSAKQKVFDAFVVVDRRERLLAGFRCEVSQQARNDLEDLLGELNYLGRSESWIQARLLDPDAEVDPNCGLAELVGSGRPMEWVEVACLKGQEEYAALPCKPVRRPKGGRGRPSKPQALSWLEAIRLSTSDLLAEGWSDPPAQKKLDLHRPAEALRTRPPRRRAPSASRYAVARYALHSTVLPRITQCVPFAERARTFLMGIHRKVMGGDPSMVSPLFAGKAPGGGPARGHKHAFFLPLDEDGDGRIDHLMVRAPQPFSPSELEALDRFGKLWQPGGRPDVTLVLVSLSADMPAMAAKQWVSATPLVIGRHHRQGRGPYVEWLNGEVRRECGFHGLPGPVAIEWIDRTTSEGHQLRWMEFVRSRKGRRPMRGHGCVLTFDEAVPGPLAIGALCHFGLGLFVPKRQ